jgi:alcohol dehydrogenase
VGVRSGEELLAYRIEFEYPDTVRQKPYDGVLMPHIAIPTTLSSAEYDGIFGYTHAGIKYLSADRRLNPRSVILDPEVTADTPAWLWASTGIRAMDHCIETYLAKTPTPLTDAAAIHGMRMLATNLPLSAHPARGMTSRLQCQLAGWLSMCGVSNVTLGLSHGIGHQLGAKANVPHGITSCVMLPVVLDYVASSLESAQPRLRRIAEAITGEPAAHGSAASAAVSRLVEQLNLPRRLRDVGVARDQFDEIAEAPMGDLVVGFSPVAVSKAQIVELLEAAY